MSLSDQIRRLGDGGFPLVQFRGKPLDASAQWQELRRALKASQDNGGWPLIAVNDRADLAVLAVQEGLPLWGLHLGQGDLPPSEARGLPGLGALHLGTSTHGPEEWKTVEPSCDHAGVGPVRGTSTKADHAAPIGFEGLREGCAALRGRGLAPVAIGGLSAGDFRSCFEAGAASVALVSALAAAPDPSELLWQAQAARWKAQAPFTRGQGLVLVGSSGAGKSTLGSNLAGRLGLPFVDLDQVIAGLEGQSIPSMFEHRGEPAFRELESTHIARHLKIPCVLALGGGAWETPEVRQAVACSGFATLWLAEPPEVCWKRVSLDPARPLAQAEDVFWDRHRQRILRWEGLPMVLPLGRGASEVAEALCSALD